MNHNNCTLADFRAVARIAELRSFRAAAENLGLSPSALSRQITGLEARLDTRLFDRDTRNITPTAQGEVLARISRRMLNVAEDGMAEFQAYLSAVLVV